MCGTENPPIDSHSFLFFLGLPYMKKIKESYYLFISFSCSKGLEKKYFWQIFDFHVIFRWWQAKGRSQWVHHGLFWLCRWIFSKGSEFLLGICLLYCLLYAYQVWGRKLKEQEKNLEVLNLCSLWNCYNSLHCFFGTSRNEKNPGLILAFYFIFL